MQDLKIGFLGGGNMAEALIAGLIRGGHDPESILVCELNQERCVYLSTEYGVQGFAEGSALVSASMLVLAVKPQQMEAACVSISPIVSDMTVVSIAAGISVGMLQSNLSHDKIVRVMPNTPSLLGKGMAVMYAHESVSPSEKKAAEYVFSSSGEVEWVHDESLMHVVTALSGSGPAYFFLMGEVMVNAGVKLGLSAEMAKKLVGQTALGAGYMLRDCTESAAELRRQVSSPGGTTQAALEAMQGRGMENAVDAGVQAATERSKQLMGED